MPDIHILLADDDPDDCFIFSQISKEVNERVKITCLSDCESLLQFLQTDPHPDVIFLDLNMPVLGGQECLRQIKENPEYNLIPIVIYSTASRKEIIDECYSLGASLYIIKPNDTEKLRDIINWVINKFVSA